MKDFKPNRKMHDGPPTNMCWGGKAMKKAEGGTVRSRFNSAFAEARKRGDKVFDFEGKKYTTELAKPKPKVEVGPHGPGSEENDYKSESSENDVVAGSRPSTEENARPTPPKQKIGYTLPDVGLRIGKQGESAITTSPSEDKSDIEPDFVRKKYSIPGVRMGQKGEPAIVIEKKRGGMAKGEKIMKKAKGGHIHGEFSDVKRGDFTKERHLQDHVTSDEVAAKAKGGANWIAGAIKHKGALHRDLGVPMGKKIPAGKLEKATHSSNPTIAKRARLAKTLASFK